MVMQMTPNRTSLEQPDVGDGQTPPSAMSPARWEGRTFGALVLAAFPLYGIGAAQAEHAIGLTLVALNSVAVTVVGLIGFRLVRSGHRSVGIGYLVTRIVEAVALAAGVALVAFADSVDADTTGYLLAMTVLGLGSMPFFRVLGQGGWLPRRPARWGVGGYALLATGALAELATGRGVSVFFAVPGGLFELGLGLYLLRRGFDAPDGVVRHGRR